MASSVDTDTPAIEGPTSLGYELSGALHDTGDGAEFSVARALHIRELGARSYRCAAVQARRHSGFSQLCMFAGRSPGMRDTCARMCPACLQHVARAGHLAGTWRAKAPGDTSAQAHCLASPLPWVIGTAPHRRAERGLQSTYAIVQPWLLWPRAFETAQKQVDKAFCSVRCCRGVQGAGDDCMVQLPDAPSGFVHDGRHVRACLLWLLKGHGGHRALGRAPRRDTPRVPAATSCHAPPRPAPPCARTATLPAKARIGLDSVLVGTKCNTLLLLDVITGAHRRVALPPKPTVRLGPELMYNPDGHCGMHAMDVSPGGRYLVTGGRAAEDAVVLRREGLTPVQTFSVGGLTGTCSRPRSEEAGEAGRALSA
jgi:hypothetical protein